jgi:hypothetical protein
MMRFIQPPANSFQPEFRNGISALAECGRPGRSNVGWTGGWKMFRDLKISKLLRPRTGALRGGLVRPTTIGNFGFRVKKPFFGNVRRVIRVDNSAQ